MRRIYNARGFTLIELLVVIAIIAILAAILFPVLMSARERSKSAACQTHVKELCTAVLMYADDNDCTLPIGNDSTPWYMPTTYVTRIEKYVKNRKIYNCPSIRIDFSAPGAVCSAYLMTDGTFNYPNRAITATRLSQITRHTRLILLLDTIVYRPYEFGTWPYDYYGDTGWGETPRSFAMTLNGKGQYVDYTSGGLRFCRHNRGANCAYVDGHARWVKSGTFTAAMFTK